MKNGFGQITWPNYLTMKQIVSRLERRVSHVVSALAITASETETKLQVLKPRQGSVNDFVNLKALVESS